jgi:hypothetical protein
MRFDHFPTWPQWEAASTSFMEKLTAKPALAQFHPTFARPNKAKVLAIDDMVKRYHKVLDMSKLNLLMQIREAIIDWATDKIDRDVGSGRLAAMKALLDVTLRTIAELDQWGRHRYVKAACIGYQIATGAYRQDLTAADAAERQRNDDADATRSCADLILAIQKAQTAYQHYVNNSKIQPDDDRKTLKIFMAPEFYFRGRYGAYQDVGLCSKIMELMRNEIRDAKYADWLFVHGTALFTTDRDVKKGGGAFLENYALVQKGGAPNKTSDLIVAKEFPSHVDFQHPTITDDDWFDPNKSAARIAGKDVKHVSPVGGRRDPDLQDLAQSRTVQVSELVGGVLFTMDNITFGLEVCRDHAIGRLAHCKEAGKALIQLIPSSGVSITPGYIGCTLNGIVFNVDGDTPHCMAVTHNPLLSKQPVNVATENHGGGDIKIFSSVDIPWPAQVRLDVAQRLDITQGVLSGEAPLPAHRA